MKPGYIFRDRKAFFALLLTPLLLISGCATILSPLSKSQDEISISSNVAGTQVYNSSRKLLGETPLKISGIDSKNGVLIAEKDGYETQTQELHVKERAGFAFLDAMLLGIPYIVDISTRAIYKPAADKIEFVMKRKITAKTEKLNAIIQDVSWKMPDGTSIGTEDKEPLLFKKTFFDSYIYKLSLCKEMQATRYKTTGCENMRDEDYYAPVARAGSIYITPEIETIKIDINTRKGTRKCDVAVTWKFSLSGDEFIIHEEKDLASFSTANFNDNKRMVLGALMQSFEKISANDELFAILQKQLKEKDFSSFNSVIAIPEPSLPKFVKQKDMIRRLMEGVITIELPNGGHGSGFFISEDGYILTNYHVVKKQKTVNVRLGQSVTLTGEVVRSNEGYDMALIKVSGKGFMPLVMGNSDSLSVGEDVLAIGTPEDVSLGQSVSKGILSGKRKYEDRVFLQTDVSVNSGNSGGPLLNESGEVVGMVTMKLVGVGTEGIGFCIPTNSIMEVLNLTYKAEK